MDPRKWFAQQRKPEKRGKAEDKRVSKLGPVDIFIQEIEVGREVVIHYTGVAKRNSFSGVHVMPLQDYQANNNVEYLQERIAEKIIFTWRPPVKSFQL